MTLLDVHSANLGATTLSQIKLVNYCVSRTVSDNIQIIIPASNALRKVSAGNNESISPQSATAAVSEPEVRTTYCVESGKAFILAMSLRDIVARASLLLARDHDEGLATTISGTIDLASPIGAALARNAEVAMREILRLDAVGLAPLTQSGFDDLLLTLATAALIPAVSNADDKPPLEHGPACIMRARDYIAANATEKIEIAQVAIDLGINLRTLQHNFKRYFGCSPREFLVECRLQQARRALLDPETESVTEVALDSGFSDLSHFAVKYCERFHELPSHTLRKTRS